VLLGCFLLINSGCTHKIHVNPEPRSPASHTIPQSVQVVVPFLALEGADHMPGIGLLEWPAKDLRAAAVDYIQKRHTFTTVSEGPADLVLTIKAWMTMRSRDTYRYALRLESDLGPAGKTSVKSYLVQQEAEGSPVRWVTASDQRPIAETVQAALDELLAQIEVDAELFWKGPS
jgi:hypothetical protein